jgi:integrase
MLGLVVGDVARQGAVVGDHHRFFVREVEPPRHDGDGYPKAVMALFTGLRCGELLALRWRNVDLDDAREIKVREALEETKAHGVRFKATKTKSGLRDISLPDIVVETLRDHRRGQLEMRMAMGLGKVPADALVFPAVDGGPQAPRQLSGDWREVRAAAGVPDVTWHALRHTHASQLIAAGTVDIVTISKRLGPCLATLAGY